MDISPGATVVLECTLDVMRPEPFESQLHVFVDDHGLREIVLTVRGEAKAPMTEGKLPQP